MSKHWNAFNFNWVLWLLWVPARKPVYFQHDTYSNSRINENYSSSSNKCLSVFSWIIYFAVIHMQPLLSMWTATSIIKIFDEYLRKNRFTMIINDSYLGVLWEFLEQQAKYNSILWGFSFDLFSIPLLNELEVPKWLRFIFPQYFWFFVVVFLDWNWLCLLFSIKNVWLNEV